jgi:hypothetical protein
MTWLFFDAFRRTATASRFSSEESEPYFHLSNRLGTDLAAIADLEGPSPLFSIPSFSAEKELYHSLRLLPV